MKIPIIITSAKGKTKEQLVDEIWNAIKKFKRIEKKVLKNYYQKSSQKKKS